MYWRGGRGEEEIEKESNWDIGKVATRFLRQYRKFVRCFGELRRRFGPVAGNGVG